jgi:NhaP-type Na+/H+ or K+/H+ antiporter
VSLSDPLVALPLLIVIGLVAQWIAWRVRVPAIVFLLGTGLVLGPGLDLLDPRELLGPFFQPLVSFAVAIILFEGGLSLRLPEARRLGWPLVGMVTIAPAVTFVLGAGAAHLLIGLSWLTAAVLAAILVVTGPTVVKPMLRQARLDRRPAQLLQWESIVNDPAGALLAVVALESSLALADGSLGALWTGIPVLIGSSALIGGLAGWGLGRAMDRALIPEHLKVPAIFGAVLAVFSGANALFHEAGLLAVTVMGVALANIASPSVESIRHFKEDVATLLVALLFLVLSSDLEWTLLSSFTFGAGAFVLAVLFVIRPLSIFAGLLGAGVPWREKALIGWIAPRGVVAAAMGAALFTRLDERGFEDARFLIPVLFVVILSTVVLHGLTVRPLARRLGVSAGAGGGLLIVGADPWVVELGRALVDAGFEVVFVDRDYRRIARARLQGLEAVYGDVLSEETLDEVPHERLSGSLAATDDDHYNSLACVALAKTFGREHVLQVTGDEEMLETDPHLRGRMPWGAEGAFDRFAGRRWSGARFGVTALTGEFDWERFRAEHENAVPLFALGARSLTPVEVGGQVPAGARVLHQGGDASG